MMNAIKTWWETKPSRERNIYILLAGLVIPICAYALAWVPLQDSRMKLEHSIVTKRLQLVQMKNEASQIKQLQSAAKVSHSSLEGLEQAILNSARIHGIAASLATPIRQANGITVQANQIGFEPWIKWLDALQKEHQVRLSQAKVTSMENAAGLVNITMGFELN